MSQEAAEPDEGIRYLRRAGLWSDASFCCAFRFKKGFESEPTLHSGINYAVLLLAAGHQFDTSFELRKVGEWIRHRISVFALQTARQSDTSMVGIWKKGGTLAKECMHLSIFYNPKMLWFSLGPSAEMSCCCRTFGRKQPEISNIHSPFCLWFCLQQQRGETCDS